MSNALSVITKQLSKESDPAFLEFTARIVESIELVLGYEPTVEKVRDLLGNKKKTVALLNSSHNESVVKLALEISQYDDSHYDTLLSAGMSALNRYLSKNSGSVSGCMFMPGDITAKELAERFNGKWMFFSDDKKLSLTTGEMS